MQTHFTPQQLENPAIAEADSILRSCVHCGFCTATCPTYVTLGNELDSPRGRIYLIKDMLESGRDAGEREAKHIDRCLSCLSCMTTCPSGVDYMHLVDHTRVHIERTHKRPLMTRLTRELLAQVLPYKGRFRASLALSKLGRPFVPLLEAITPLKPLAAMLKLAPSASAPKVRETRNGEAFEPKVDKRGRVALLTGCAQPALDSGINAATIELLTGQGIEVVLPKGETCCGSLVHHMGREKQALGFARRMVDVWHAEAEKGLDAIVITTSGCGTTIKDYGHMLRHDPAYAEKAATVAALAKDVSEYLVSLELPEPAAKARYHSRLPRRLLVAAWAENQDRAKRPVARCRFHGSRSAGKPPVLRVRRHLQHPATRHRGKAAGQEGCGYRKRQAGRDCGGQYRVPDPDRQRHGHTHSSHRQAAELGVWRGHSLRAKRCIR